MIKSIFTIPLIFLVLFSLLNEDSYSDETRGRELFEEKRCVRCHTIGRGKFVGPDLFGIKDKYNEQEIVDWIVNPQLIYQKLKKMPVNTGYPPMPNLNISESDARDLTQFLINNDIDKTSKIGGEIKGKVINKTTGRMAEGIDVYVQSFIGDRKTGEKLSITDENGTFEFKNLKWDNSYSIRIKSNGVEYETAKMVFPPEKEVIDLNLPIFEAAGDDTSIVINVNHQVLATDEKIISIAEIYELENRDNKIYTGKGEAGSDISRTIKFYIPKEAQNLSFIEGLNRENIIREENILYDTTSFPPGRKRVVITYDLPLKFGNNLLNKEIFYQTKTMLVLATESKNKFTVSGLTEMEPIFIDKRNYMRWVGENIDTGSNIKISYYSMILEFKTIELYPIFIFAILFIAAVVFGLLRVNSKNNLINTDDLRESRNKVLIEIAQLDIKHDNDEIESEQYRVIRSELKKSLVLLEKLLNNPKGPPYKTE
ncbi:MAG: c-type cytochrome [Thermodesulfobacteriota bacterium]